MNCPRQTLAVVLGLSLAVPLAAFSPQEPQGRIRTTVELVVVPVTVKDSAGRIVSGIPRDEFRILEDGVEQQLSLFSADAYPLSAVVLLDNDLKLKESEKVQASLRSIAGAFGPNDEVALFRFDVFPEQVMDFTRENDKLFTELQRVELGKSFPGQGSGPMTSGPRINAAPAPGAPTRAQTPIQGTDTKTVDDAIYAAGEALRSRDRERRKIIFIVSDGRNSLHNTMQSEAVIRLLLSSDISVYAVGVGRAGWNRGINVLSKYAHATGGDIFYGSSRRDLETLYARVADEARNQYTLGYVPQHTDRSVEFHSIEVRVRRPNLTLLARDGYYSTPPR